MFSQFTSLHAFTPVTPTHAMWAFACRPRLFTPFTPLMPFSHFLAFSFGTAHPPYGDTVSRRLTPFHAFQRRLTLSTPFNAVDAVSAFYAVPRRLRLFTPFARFHAVHAFSRRSSLFTLFHAVSRLLFYFTPFHEFHGFSHLFYTFYECFRR